MDETQLNAIAEKISRLISHCEKLNADNQILRQQQDEWQQERARLLQKNDLAKNKIEAMIGRLKALEQK